MLLGNGLLPHFGIAGGGGLLGATWARDGNGRAYNTPTRGAELLADGGFENWLSATNATSWTESAAGTSSVNREATIIHGGTYAARFDIDASNNAASVTGSSGAAVGTWLYIDWWTRASAGGKTLRMATGAQSLTIRDPGTAWTNYIDTFRVVAVGDANIVPGYRVSAASASLYIDDVSVKPLSVPTLHAYRLGTSNAQIAAARVNALTTGTQAGAFALVDNPSNPQNGIYAYHDGVGVTMDKLVNGVWSTVVPRVTLAFSADMDVSPVPIGGNQWQLWAGGSQRGSTVTISDASIVNNLYYGLFSTYSGNTFTRFTLDGNVIPFGF